MPSNVRAGRHSLYGNQNGLPGLPKTSYVTRKPVRETPRLPPQPAPQTRAVPRPQVPQPQPPLMPTGPDPFVTRRMDMLEQRLNSSEQSNRALMDEIMRLQQDMKMQIKKNEMGLGDEKESKGRLEIAMRQAQGHQYEIDDRVKRCEDGIKEARNSIQQLMGQIQGVEKLAHAIQYETSERSGLSSGQSQEYQRELMKLSQSTENTERYYASLREDNRSLQSQLDSVKRELGSLQNNVKLQARLLEDNAKKPMMQNTNNDTLKMNETERIVIEGKIISLNNMIQDLSSRLSAEAKKRGKVEADVNARVNELMEEFGATQREKDNELRKMEDNLKDLQSGFSVSEKQKIHTEISSVAQDLQRKMDQKEAKLRSDTVDKLTVIEKTLVDENKRRQEEEKKLRDDVGRQMQRLDEKEKDAGNDLRSALESHTKNSQERIGDITKRMNKVEDSLRSLRLEHDRVLTAEINERQRENKMLEGKVEDLEDRLAEGLTNLQASIGDTKNNSKSSRDSKSSSGGAAAAAASEEKMAKLADMQQKNEESIRKQLAKEVGALDKRLVEVETSVRQQDEKIENELKSAATKDDDDKAMMGDKMQTQIDNLEFQQKKLDKQVNELKDKVQDTPKGLQDMKSQMAETEEKLNDKLAKEIRERKAAEEEIREDIDRIIGKRDATVPSLAQVQSDMDATQTGMKKLAEAVHVVKTSLMERIKDEKRLREQETIIMKGDVERLDTKYHEIKERIRAGDTFEADDDDYAY